MRHPELCRISTRPNIGCFWDTHHEETPHCLARLGKVVVLDGSGNETALFLALFPLAVSSDARVTRNRLTMGLAG